MAAGKPSPILVSVPDEALAGGELIRANFVLSLAGTPFHMSLPVPKGPTTLRVMLPVFRAMTEGIIHAAVRGSAAAGKAVSCKAGCGACCCQLVPIARAEAHVLAELLEALPEPRRTEIRGRFAAAWEKLAAAGLLDRLEAAALNPERAVRRAVGLEYFAQKIPCPFLEKQSCSIYADRPLVCREYLVTNDPVHCGNPQPGTIARVGLAADVSTAVARCGTPADAPLTQWTVLILSPRWVREHPEEPALRTGPELFADVMGHLTGKSIPRAPGEE